jgi:hypothetical protein
MVAAAAGAPVAENEVDQARRIGQAWVEKIAVIDPEMAEWQGTYLTWAVPFHNTKGEVIAYMFAVERNGKTVGRVLVGSAAYGYSILEGTKAPPFSIPSPAEVSSILRKEHGLRIPEVRLGEPLLLLTHLLHGFFAVWEFEGQVVGINLMTDYSFVAPRPEALRSFVPSPLEYKAAKRATGQSAPPCDLGLRAAGWGAGWIPSDNKSCAAWAGVYRHFRTLWCGPASATTIALWKREVDGDLGFPACAHPGTQWSSTLEMFDGFHHAMGLWPWTLPGHWASGFISYAQSRNEHFTLETRLPGTYWQIVSDINAAWPLGLMGEMDISLVTRFGRR